jgi:hypothetical protein
MNYLLISFTPFLISPKGDMITTLDMVSFPLGEGWEGGNRIQEGLI